MNVRVKLFVTRYLGLILFSLVFAVIFIFSRWSEAITLAERYKVLSDGCAVPGMLVTSYGLLVWIYSTGGMDGFLYGMDRLGKAFIPNGRSKIESYGDFVERKSASRDKPFIHFIIVGGSFILLSLLFVVLYNTAK